MLEHPQLRHSVVLLFRPNETGAAETAPAPTTSATAALRLEPVKRYWPVLLEGPSCPQHRLPAHTDSHNCTQGAKHPQALPTLAASCRSATRTLRCQVGAWQTRADAEHCGARRSAARGGARPLRGARRQRRAPARWTTPRPVRIGNPGRSPGQDPATVTKQLGLLRGAGLVVGDGRRTIQVIDAGSSPDRLESTTGASTSVDDVDRRATAITVLASLASEFPELRHEMAQAVAIVATSVRDCSRSAVATGRGSRDCRSRRTFFYWCDCSGPCGEL